MSSNYYSLLDEYLVNSFVNFSLQWDIISSHSWKISDDRDSLNDVALSDKFKNLKSEQEKLRMILDNKSMWNIFSRIQNINNSGIELNILIKSFIISYFSIFELFIRDIAKELWIDYKVNIEDIIKSVWKDKLWVNLRSIIWDEVYKGFLEFKKRRNLLIHYDGVIDQDYLDYIYRFQLDDFILELSKVDGMECDLSVWKKLLSTPNYFQIIHVEIDTIWLIIGILLLKKLLKRKEFNKKLNKIEDLLIMNGKYSLIWTVYSRLNDEIDFNNCSKLNFLYCLSRFQNIFKDRNSRAKIKDINKKINSFLPLIEFKELNDIEKIMYFVLLNDYTSANKELRRVNMDEDFLYEILDSKILYDYFINNIEVIVEIVKENNMDVSIRRNTSVIGCKNILLLNDMLLENYS